MEIPSLFDPTILIQLVLFVGLLGCSAFFSGSEVAMFSLNQIQLDQMARENHPRLALIRELLKDPRALITTILIGNELVNVAASNISATLLITFLGGEENWWVNILVMLPILLLFGEITPKTIAVRNNIVVAGLICHPLSLFRRGITPLRKIVGLISNYFITLAIGEQKEKTASVTEEMVRTLAAQASLDGVLDDTEKTYIDNIFNFGNIRVRDVMIPRAKIFFLAKSTPPAEIIRIFKQTGYTRLPVYEGHRDDVIGIIHVRDLLQQYQEAGKNALQPMSLIRKPYFIAANRLASSLFQTFKERNQSVAMVVDEYGGLVGMITMHDLMEIIFGPLHMKPNFNPQTTVRPVMVNGCYPLKGITSIEEFMQLTGEELVDVQAETVGGLVLDALGEVPEKGRKVMIGRWEFTVLEMDNNRIASLLACIKENDTLASADPPAPLLTNQTQKTSENPPVLEGEILNSFHTSATPVNKV
ncbi:MAG: HlyC/CorC family transporter [Magnetococcales bacterium]|nr:HlyC/CorC family transporter [Magnetococcales bacterium]NGZ06766.1 HlyC/CorC family transporter [Magnetococcales bacterium]